MSKYLPYFFVLLLGVGLCWLCMQGCHRDSGIQKIQDSLQVEKKLNDTLKLRTTQISSLFDSTSRKNSTDSLMYNHKIDSFKRVTEVFKKSFLATRDTIASLHNRLSMAFINLDTVGVYRLADSLNNELVNANNQLFEWQISRDSTDNVQAAEIKRLRMVVSDLQTQIVQFKALLIQCTDNASGLAKNANKAINKAKAWSVFGKIGAGIAGLLAVLLIAHK